LVETSKSYVKEENVDEGIKMIIEFSQVFGSSVRQREKRKLEKKQTKSRPW
jgi:hypothetical protein